MAFSSFYSQKNISQNDQILPQYIYCLIINAFFLKFLNWDKTLHPGNKNMPV
jgi:hypothetical protein